MRVLIVSAGYPPTRTSGSASYSKELAEALAADDHDVHVLAISGSERYSQVRSDGVTLHRQGASLLVRALMKLTRAHVTIGRLHHAILTARLARRLRPDIIEVPESRAAGLFLRPMVRTPFVVQLHSPWELTDGLNEVPKTLDRQVAYWLDRKAIECASLVTYPSERLPDLLRTRGWRFARDELVPGLPLDTAPWETVRPVEDTDEVVLFVGRVDRTKGADVLLGAAELLARQGCVPRFVLVGALSDHSTVRADVGARLERARIAGARIDVLGGQRRDVVRELMDHARILVLPSRFDFYPVAVLEAMAAGRPVIVSDQVGLAESVRASNCGAVVCAGSARDLATAMSRFLSDPREVIRAGGSAARLACDLCDRTRYATSKATAYAGLVGAASPARAGRGTSAREERGSRFNTR
jgi:glycosyltransferase involved in cell wall biosynthesis